MGGKKERSGGGDDRFYLLAVLNIVTLLVCAPVHFVTFYWMASAVSDGAFAGNIAEVLGGAFLLGAYWLMFAGYLALLLLGLFLKPQRTALLGLNLLLGVAALAFVIAFLWQALSFSSAVGTAASIVMGGTGIVVFSWIRLALHAVQCVTAVLLLRRRARGRII